MSVIIIITTPPGSQQQSEGLTAQEDGTVTDAEGAVRMSFNSYADAIAYLEHMSGQSWSEAEATDDRS